jgi:hypothetical protein
MTDNEILSVVSSLLKRLDAKDKKKLLRTIVYDCSHTSISVDEDGPQVIDLVEH